MAGRFWTGATSVGTAVAVGLGGAVAGAHLGGGSVGARPDDASAVRGAPVSEAAPPPDDFTYRVAGTIAAAAPVRALAVDERTRTVFAANQPGAPTDPQSTLSFLDPVTRTRTGVLPLPVGVRELNADPVHSAFYAGGYGSGSVVVDTAARKVLRTDSRPSGRGAVADPARDRLVFGFYADSPAGDYGYAALARTGGASTVLSRAAFPYGPIALDGRTRRLFVPDYDGGNQSPVLASRDADTFGSVRRSVVLTDGQDTDGISALAVDDRSGTVVVGLDDELVLVDGGTLQEVGRVPLPPYNRAVDVAVDPGSSTAYALLRDRLVVADTDTGQVRATIPVEGDPTALAVDTVHHQAYVGVADSPLVTVVDETARPRLVTAVSGDGQLARPGERFRRPLAVAVTGARLHPVPGVAVPFTVAAGSARFASGTSATATTGPDGIATAPTLTAGATGAVTVTATVTAVTEPARFSVEVGPAAAAQVITIGADSGQLQQSSAEVYPLPLVATVRDAAGRPVAGELVRFETRYRVEAFPDAAYTALVRSGPDGRAVAPPLSTVQNDTGEGPVVVFATSSRAVGSAFVVSQTYPKATPADLAVSVSVQPGPTAKTRRVAVTVTNRGPGTVSSPLVALDVPLGALLSSDAAGEQLSQLAGHYTDADPFDGFRNLAPGSTSTPITGFLTLTGTGPVTLTAGVLSTQPEPARGDNVARVVVR